MSVSTMRLLPVCVPTADRLFISPTKQVCQTSSWPVSGSMEIPVTLAGNSDKPRPTMYSASAASQYTDHDCE